MVTTIVLASGSFMSSIECSKRLSNLGSNSDKNMTAIGFRGQPPRGGGGAAVFRQARRQFLVYGVHPGSPPPPPTGNSPNSWQQWIFGVITTVIIPFFTRKWTKILQIKDEVDTVFEETEKIVDYIEEAAETVDKVARDVVDHLPEGGKWRNAVVFVEDVTEEIAREAHMVEDFLHEVFFYFTTNNFVTNPSEIHITRANFQRILVIKAMFGKLADKLADELDTFGKH